MKFTRPPFPGAWWFLAGTIVGIIRIIANATNTDGVWLTVFVLFAIGFYRYVTRIPIGGDHEDRDH